MHLPDSDLHQPPPPPHTQPLPVVHRNDICLPRAEHLLLHGESELNPRTHQEPPAMPGARLRGRFREVVADSCSDLPDVEHPSSGQYVQRAREALQSPPLLPALYVQSPPEVPNLALGQHVGVRTQNPLGFELIRVGHQHAPNTKQQRPSVEGGQSTRESHSSVASLVGVVSQGSEQHLQCLHSSRVHSMAHNSTCRRKDSEEKEV